MINNLCVLGRRVCLGESLAKMELYLFMSAILQKFTLSSVPGEELKLEIDRNNMVMNSIKPYKVILTPRI